MLRCLHWKLKRVSKLKLKRDEAQTMWSPEKVKDQNRGSNLQRCFFCHGRLRKSIRPHVNYSFSYYLQTVFGKLNFYSMILILFLILSTDAFLNLDTQHLTTSHESDFCSASVALDVFPPGFLLFLLLILINFNQVETPALLLIKNLEQRQIESNDVMTFWCVCTFKHMCSLCSTFGNYSSRDGDNKICAPNDRFFLSFLALRFTFSCTRFIAWTSSYLSFDIFKMHGYIRLFDND